MRILWKEASAQSVAASLEQIQGQMEAAALQAERVRTALSEANPGGDDKAVNAVTERFESLMKRLSDAAADADSLLRATRSMIDIFEETERSAVRILNELDTGRNRENGGRPSGGAYAPVAHGEMPVPPPIPLPRVRIAPEARLSPLGPVMGWLVILMDKMTREI